MSKKTNEPHDLFSAAGLSEHAFPEVGKLERAAPAAKPARTSQQKAKFSAVEEGASSERYLRDTAVAQRYGVSRQTVWRWVAQGRLPEPIKLSEGATRWRVSDLLAHEASLPRGAKATVGRSRGMKITKSGGQQ